MQARALAGLPVLWLLMLGLHFRSLADFFTLRLRYEPVPARDKVAGLIAAQNHWPMIHDPHLIGYLSLPLLVLGAFGLFTALIRGLGYVEVRYLDGAAAVYGAVTANQGAYGLTRALAQLALLGIALQAAVLWGAPGIPWWAPVVVSLGCALFLAFWDIDNLMFVGAICLLAGCVPMSKALRQSWSPG